MVEKILFCKDCHQLFVFSVKEQRHFSLKGWKAPCRCPDCRKLKKERECDPYADWQSTMGCPRFAKRGHRRINYRGLIVAGGLSS